MIDLKFPRTTIVGKPVPKNAFYKHLEVNAKIKQHFVDDVVSIHWLYKLAPSTINVEDGKLVHEIVVFSAALKSKDCPDDVFLFIDQNMPRHVVFLLEYADRYKVLLNYKEWKDGPNGPFKIIKTFATEWLTDNQLLLTLEGQNMDALYEAMAGQVSGFGTKKAEDTKRIVALEGLIDKAKREVDVLQRQIRNERQLNRQMELNGEARGIKKQIALWQNELQKINSITMEQPERLSLQSADGAQLNLDALYQIAPSCFTEAADPTTGKIKRVVNFDVLRQLLGDETVEGATEAYEFNWVGKQEARAEVLRPIHKTLRPVKEDSVDWDNTQNLYIEGDNLEVLKLLQKSYLGKVKMIYIDPPYNTGNDFVYHDDFARTQAEEDLFAGNVDELGNRYIKNTDSNGKYHSDWCSMIYSRLMVARSLLAEDGVIFISIDDGEQENLRKICDEIFGEQNFLNNIVWQKKYTIANDAHFFSDNHDFILCYVKDIQNFIIGRLPRTEEMNAAYKNPDNHPKGPWKATPLHARSGSVDSANFSYTFKNGVTFIPPTGTFSRYSSETLKRFDEGDEIWFGNDGKSIPSRKTFLCDLKKDGIVPHTFITFQEGGHNHEAVEEIKVLLGNNVFTSPKPTKLLRLFCTIANLDKDSIILDFFSGSATTAHAVMQLNAEDGGNRKFIMVQLPEETEEDSEAYKAGYKNICEIGKERIRRAGKKIKEEHPDAKDLDTGFRVFRVDESNFEDVERTPTDWNQGELDFYLNNIKKGRTDLDLLFGCMLDWGVKLSLPMSSEEVDGKMVYTVNEGDLVACFAEKVTDNVVKAMAEKQPLRVIFRDSCFERDADKINIYETFKQLLDWSDQDVVKNIRVI